jgi:hypothetical protein
VTNAWRQACADKELYDQTITAMEQPSLADHTE